MLMLICKFYILPFIQDDKTKKQKRKLVKSNGTKKRLSQFCTLKQNQLPLACLGVEGEGSTQKQCNYSALAQQQSAKKSIKGFPLSKIGLPLRKSTTCV